MLSNAALLTALGWVHARASDRARGRRQWTTADQATTDEAHARSWAFGELQALKLWVLPSWWTLLKLPPRRDGYSRFLGFLLRAYRARAVGVLLSYEEAMSLCDVRSRSTWRAWCKDWEARGLVRIVQTWVLDAEGRPCYGRLLYRIGPAFEELAGPGLCEDAAGGDGPAAAWCQRIGIGLRRRARDARRDRKREAWQETRPGQDDPSKRLGAPAGASRPGPTSPPESAAACDEVDAAPSVDASSSAEGSVGASSGPASIPTRESPEKASAPSGSSVVALQSAPWQGALRALPAVERDERPRLPAAPLQHAGAAGPELAPTDPSAELDASTDGAASTSSHAAADSGGDVGPGRDAPRATVNPAMVDFLRTVADSADRRARGIARRELASAVELDQGGTGVSAEVTAADLVERSAAGELDHVDMLAAFTRRLGADHEQRQRRRAKNTAAVLARYIERTRPPCSRCTYPINDCPECGGTGRRLTDDERATLDAGDDS